MNAPSLALSNRPHLRVPLLLAALVAFVAAGCKDDKTTAPEPPTPVGDVEVRFVEKVGADSLVFDDLRYTNAFGNAFSVTKLQYLASSFVLHTDDGDDLSFDVTHFRDAREDSTERVHFHDVPVNHYHEITFTFGLSEADNVTGGLPTTPEFSSMIWPESWGGGYHYMKMEGQFVDTHAIQRGYPTHVGRFRADPDSASHPHFFTVTLETHMNVVEGETNVVEAVMDVAQWYTDPDTVNLETFVGGIMPRTSAQDTLEANATTGLQTVWNVGTITGDAGHGR